MPPAQTRLDQIRDLVNQWEQLVGYTVTVPDWMVYEMAEKQTSAGWVTNLYGLGQYMKDHTAPGPYNLVWMNAPFQPWAWYGMSASEYSSKLEQFDSTFQQLTGQPVTADLVDRAPSRTRTAGSSTASTSISSRRRSFRCAATSVAT
jgi:hypothetical protein